MLLREALKHNYYQSRSKGPLKYSDLVPHCTVEGTSAVITLSYQTKSSCSDPGNRISISNEFLAK